MNKFEFKELLRKNYGIIVIVIIIGLVYLLFAINNLNFDDFKYKWWFDGLSKQEQQEYFEGKIKYSQAEDIVLYKITSIKRDNDNVVDHDGNPVLSLEMTYDEETEKTLDDYYKGFISHEGFGRKLVIGYEDVLVVVNRGYREYIYLQLTKETMQLLDITKKEMKEDKINYWYIKR